MGFADLGVRNDGPEHGCANPCLLGIDVVPREEDRKAAAGELVHEIEARHDICERMKAAHRKERI